jgi:hypothetical protein
MAMISIRGLLRQQDMPLTLRTVKMLNLEEATIRLIHQVEILIHIIPTMIGKAITHHRHSLDTIHHNKDIIHLRLKVIITVSLTHLVLLTEALLLGMDPLLVSIQKQIHIMEVLEEMALLVSIPRNIHTGIHTHHLQDLVTIT